MVSHTLVTEGGKGKVSKLVLVLYWYTEKLIQVARLGPQVPLVGRLDNKIEQDAITVSSEVGRFRQQSKDFCLFLPRTG